MKVSQKKSRRDFLKLLGQGTVVLGAGSTGLLERLWAQSQVPADLHLADGPEWEFYKPGVYDANDQKIIDKFKAELDALNSRGKISFADLISGKFKASQPGGGNIRGLISHEELTKVINNFGGGDPLFSDPAYAAKTKYGKCIAPPVIGVDEYMPPMPTGTGFGDFMVVSHWNGTTNFNRPVYEGDTLYSVIDEQHFHDVTPAAGSHYRTFVLSGTGRCFNQKGEIVSEGANVLTESFRRHKDKSKRTLMRAWESPDWWHQRPVYQYTDNDWEKIIYMWKAEKRRGSTPLYWDDVKVGAEIPILTNPPILAEVNTNMQFFIPVWATHLKRDIVDPVAIKSLVKNKQGIYVPSQYVVKKVETDTHPGMEAFPPDYANRDGRSVVQNSFCAKWAAVMFYNWIGDDGWLARMGWDIMPKPPGYPTSVIPTIPRADYPSMFDKIPYLDHVPSMRGRYAETHPLEGDIITNHGYVIDKFKKDNDYFADVIWWCETYDKYVVQEGFATVKLPKRA